MLRKEKVFLGICECRYCLKKSIIVLNSKGRNNKLKSCDNNLNGVIDDITLFFESYNCKVCKIKKYKYVGICSVDNINKR